LLLKQLIWTHFRPDLPSSRSGRVFAGPSNCSSLCGWILSIALGDDPWFKHNRLARPIALFRSDTTPHGNNA
jgi:hypothetical protein